MTYPAWFLAQPYRPPMDTIGEQDADALHLQVGRICHRWEYLENQLYDLFMWLCEKAHPEEGVNLGAYRAAYGAIISTASRRDITQAVANSVYHPKNDMREKIKQTLTRVGRAVGRRNEGAHGFVSSVTKNGKHLGLFLVPPHYVPFIEWDFEKPLDERTNLKYQYNAATLAQIAELISMITDELMALVDEVKA